jgi:hypothetical protein
MARNYDMIHLIRNRMANMDDKLASVVVRMFNRLEEHHIYAAALSTSITLHLAFQYLELKPKLVLGTVQFQGLSYPHAWLELDDKIFDLATYFDIKNHPVLKDRNLNLINPQINVEYEDAAKDGVCYYPFQFGETWEMASMKRLVGKDFVEYAGMSPMVDIWGDLCYILELTETKDNLQLLGAMAKVSYIKDTEE